jgi:pimeloyl-ACP methyl ester carboxylesterase
MIVTHGWPGSVIEQLKIIGPLTNPEAHGGHATDVFHIVVPSLPGYGFSGKPAAAGWVPERVARTWTALMKRLGFGRKTAIGVRSSRNSWAHKRHPGFARHPHKRVYSESVGGTHRIAITVT